ncbi:pentapeptide repeat-containing protein [Candidatus Saganbacteria bacterium]|nr:pentapeptide repeat-containing protein [Candidatus Saganbacteria bacterium]
MAIDGTKFQVQKNIWRTPIGIASSVLGPNHRSLGDVARKINESGLNLKHALTHGEVGRLAGFAAAHSVLYLDFSGSVIGPKRFEDTHSFSCGTYFPLLSGASLRFSTFGDASFTDLDARFSNLTGVDLSHALVKGDFAKAWYDAATKFSAGFSWLASMHEIKPVPRTTENIG